MSQDDSLFEIFILSCQEQLAGIEKDLLDLEARGGAPASVLDNVFRAAHSIKADAGSLGLTDLVALAHAAEGVLSGLRDGRGLPSPEVVETLLAAFDAISRLVVQCREPDRQDVTPLVERLKALREACGAASIAPKAPDVPARDPAGDRITRITLPAQTLDSLVDRVGELVSAQGRLARLAERLGSDELRLSVEEMERVAEGLREEVMDMRLLPLRIVFAKYRRLVHDLCRELGKEAELVLSGEEIEMDKATLEQLGGPLSHLIRNALDHGIEPPEARSALGKPRKGRIWLRAEQEGSDIRITVEDDGRGLDPERIRRRARDMGLLPPDRDLSGREILDLVFLPGLSTSQQATPISGRGVGMDAVKKAVSDMRGRIEMSGAPGQGARFDLHLPLSLSLLECLHVRLDDTDFFLHMDYVEECVEAARRPDTGRIPRSLPVRGALLTLLDLRDLFEVEGNAPALAQAVVVRSAGRRYGLVVDAVMGKRQAVFKKLSRSLGPTPGVQGCSVADDGRMALILDVPGLVALAERLDAQPPSGPERT